MTDCDRTECNRSGASLLAHQVRLVPAVLLVAVALGLAAVVLAVFPFEPAHAQDDVTEPELISVQVQSPPGEDSIPKGGSATFLVLRSGDTSGEQEVILYTREPNRFARGGIRENRTQHRLRFGPGDTEIKAQAPVLGSDRDYGEFQDPETLDVNVWAVGSPAETFHEPELSIPIRQATAEDVFLSIAAAVGSIDEGGDPEFTLTRVGDTSSAATTTVRVEDPDDAMLGNHWDDALQSSDYRRTAIFAEGVATTSVSFHVRPNIRDTGDLVLTAFVEEGNVLNQWVGHSYSASVTVTDDDTAPEVSLSVDRSEVLEGEEVTFTLTRHGDTTQVLESPPFSVRIGPTDPRGLYREEEEQEAQNYGVSVEAGRSELEWVLDTEYDEADSDFTFEAKFVHQDSIPEDSVGEYYRVRGERSVQASVSNRSPPVVAITGVGAGELEYRLVGGDWVLSEVFYEGQEVPFTLRRTGTVEQIAERLEVRLAYGESNHPDRVIENGRTVFNPSFHYVYVTFEEGETQAGGTFTVAVDEVDEPVSTSTLDIGDFRVSRPPRADYETVPQSIGPDETGHVVVLIEDNPAQAIAIGVAAGNSTVNEGETAEFILTRTGSTDDALTVEVSIDDPGDFRRGNHWEATPTSTTSVTFAAASATATLAVSTRNDLRDIPDNTLTVTIQTDPDHGYRRAFESEGEYSASVTVTDDDTAPEVSLSVDRSEVLEGEEVTFTLTRHGDTTQALESPPFSVRIGPTVSRGLYRERQEAQDYGVSVEAGRSELEWVLDTEYDGADSDFTFEAKFVHQDSIPEDSVGEYYRVRGERSVQASVSNRSPPVVAITGVGAGELEYHLAGGVWVLSEVFYEGQEVPFTLRRTGTVEQIAERLEVRLAYGERNHPGRVIANGSIFNPSFHYVYVTFEEGETQAGGTFTVAVDEVDEPVSTSTLDIGDFRVSRPPRADYETVPQSIGPDETGHVVVLIEDNPAQAIAIEVAAGNSTVSEGETAEFILTRTGATDDALTVEVSIDDPGDFRRGNYWEATPTSTTSVTFAAASATATLAVSTRNDLRDIPDNTLTVTIQTDTGIGYRRVFESEGEYSASVTVTDDDTAPEVSLSVDRSAIDEGESLTFTLTRHGDVSHALEGRILLGVAPDSRRQLLPYVYEEGQYVRADFPAGQSSLDFEYEVRIDLENKDFRFEARVAFNNPGRTPIPDSDFGEYLMIRGDRTVGASVRNQPLQTISFASVGGVPFTDRTLQDNVVGQIFYEGQQVPFVLQRSGTEAQIARELEVRVRYYEPYHPYVDAQVVGRTFNPSEQLIFITFPAGNTEAGGTFDVSIDDVDETLEEGVTVGQDWMALYVNPPIFSGYGSTYISVHTGVTTNIHENPQAVSISRADDDSSIDEGETAEFLLTRHGSTSTALTLNVSIDDPGDFRRGNHWRNTPDQIVPVRFSEGSATATLSVPTQDDWRDIPDNTITA